MVRAGIFIGVDKAGDMQKLNDAAAGATRMHDWARSRVQRIVEGLETKRR